jgi:hypothetical protein
MQHAARPAEQRRVGKLHTAESGADDETAARGIATTTA